MTYLYSVEITQTQLLIAGLLSGGGVVGIIVRSLTTAPERESAAYKAGVLDEKKRCDEEVREIRTHAINQSKEITTLRNGLLRLAIDADLTPNQRSEIAAVLGYQKLSEPKEVMLDNETDGKH